jgi:hypothetical protein
MSRPRPDLWSQVSDRQVFLTAPEDLSPKPIRRDPCGMYVNQFTVDAALEKIKDRMK